MGSHEPRGAASEGRQDASGPETHSGELTFIGDVVNTDERIIKKLGSYANRWGGGLLAVTLDLEPARFEDLPFFSE